MRGKIVLGVISFITIVSLGLTVLLFNVTPVKLKRQTFSAQINVPLETDVSYYVKASEKVIEKCELHIEEVEVGIMATYPAYIVYNGHRFDFQIMIEDTQQPIIQLKDESSAVVSCYIGQTFNASDLVTVTDDTTTAVFFEDSKGKSEPVESVTLKKEGNHEYFIYAIDSSKNQSKKIRVRFEVGIDTSKPIITGIDPVTLKVGDPFDKYEGVIAYDNADGDITPLLVASGEVNTSKVGQYTITYTVADTSGNKAIDYRVITVTQSGTIGQVDVGNGPFLTETQIQQRDAIVSSLLTSELNYFADSRFIENMNRYLASHFNRSNSSSDNSSYSVIVKQRGNRMAMVRAVKVLLDARGIENYIVYGQEENMAWNIVRIDNHYRHLDVYANAIFNDENYCYLLKTSELGEAYAFDETTYPSCE